jgi:hypothetical protein
MCVRPVATLKLVRVRRAYGVLVRDGSSTPFAGLRGIHDGHGQHERRSARRDRASHCIRRRSAVAVQAASFSTALADQTVTVPFAPLIDLPITIWVVQRRSPLSSSRAHAVANAHALFPTERVGIRMDALEIVDATESQRRGWSAFACGASNANVAALQAAIGARAESHQRVSS